MTWRLVRIVLTLLLIGSLAFSGMRVLEVWRTPVAERLVSRGAAEIEASVERLSAHAATPDAIAARISARLAETPRNWVVIASLEGLAVSRAVTLPADLRAALDNARAEDHGVLVTGLKCAKCSVDSDACDLSAALLCRAIVDVTVLGDIRGVIVEGGNYALGQEVDEIDLTLSTVGLGATVLTPVTFGSSLTVKAGAGVAKTARRVGSLSPGITDLIRRTARDAIDWKTFSRRSGDGFAASLRAAVRPDALTPLMRVAEHAGDMRRSTGNLQALHLMRYVDTPDDARDLALVASVGGPRTAGLLDIVGKSRLIRATLRWSDEIFGAVYALIAALVAALGLVLSVAQAAILRWLRRLTKRRASD